MPDSEFEQQDWDQRDGKAGAYRELASHDDEHDAPGYARAVGR